MSNIILHSPIGKELSYKPELTTINNPKGGKVAFLFNGHVSVLPFWSNLEARIISVLEPSDTMRVVKPNTFAPATSSTIDDLSSADLAIVGVCA
jgi:hypothetical protein